MKFKRVIAEILAVVLCINTISISTLAENEAQTFIEVMEQEHVEPVMDQWGEGDFLPENDMADTVAGDSSEGPASGSVVDQWGDDAEIFQPEEITAAETAEGEVAEAEAEVTGSVLAGESHSAQQNGDAAYVTDDSGAVQYYADLLEAFTDAAGLASSSVVLLDDYTLTGTNTLDIKSSAGTNRMTIDLNGHSIKGSGSSVLNLANGEFCLKDSISEGNQTVRPENGIINEEGGYAVNILNLSVDGTVFKPAAVSVESGLYKSDGVVFAAWLGSLTIDSGKYPYVFAQHGDPVSQGDSGRVKLSGGVYSSLSSLKMKSFVNTTPSGTATQGYGAYYVKAQGYYVVQEKHPFWLRAAVGTDGISYPEIGYDSIGSLMTAIRQRASVVPVSNVYLMEPYDGIKAGETSISLTSGDSILLDLYGNQFTGVANVTIGSGAYLEITDSLIGGFFQLTTGLSISPEGTLLLSGGSYNALNPKDPDFLNTYLKEGYKKILTERDGVTCYTVVREDSKILIVGPDGLTGKGSAASFDDITEKYIDEKGEEKIRIIPGAFSIAEPGDKLILLSDYALTRVNEKGKTVGTQLLIEKPVTIDLNGHSLTSTYDYVVYVPSSGSGASIINSSTNKASIYGNTESGTTTYAVYVQNDAASGESVSFSINNVTLKAVNKAGLGSSCCLSTAGPGPCNVEAENCIFEKISSQIIEDIGLELGPTIKLDSKSSCVLSGSKTALSGGQTSDYAYGKILDIGSDAELIIDCSTKGSDLQSIAGVNPYLKAYVSGTLTLNDGYFPCSMKLAHYSNSSFGTVDIRGGLYGPKEAEGGTSFFDETFEDFKEDVYIYGGNFDVNSVPLDYFAPGCYQVAETVPGYSYTVGIGSAIKSHSVIIGDGLFLKIGIQKNPKLKQIVKDTDIMIKVTWLAENGTAKKTDYYDITKARDEDKVPNDTPVEGAYYDAYYVRIPFSPQNMTDGFIIEAESINTKLQYPRQDWGVMVPEQVNTTVREYTQKTYTKYPTKTAQNDALATMLMFGAEAQRYAQYKTKDLADNVAWLTDAIKAKYTEVPEDPGFERKGVLFTGHSIDLGSQYAVKLFIDTAKLDGTKDYCVVVDYATHTAYFPEAVWKTIKDANTGKELTYAEIPGIMYMNSHITYRARMQEGSFEGETWVGQDVTDVSGETADVESATTGVNRYLYDFCTAEEKKSAGKEAFGYTAYRFGIYSNKFSAAGK